MILIITIITMQGIGTCSQELFVELFHVQLAPVAKLRDGPVF